MATIDITPHVQPLNYGDADQWASISAIGPNAAATIELSCYSKYTRRDERFTVLYQGPAGSMRMEHGGPQLPGPVGCLIPQASVLAATHITQPRIIRVIEGDVLVINGQRMVIVDDNPQGYPQLVTEVEAGIRAAVQLILRDAAEDANFPTGDEAARIQWTARMEMRSKLAHEIRSLAPSLRQKYAAPAKR